MSAGGSEGHRGHSGELGRRILVLGSPGSGKTLLAKRLGAASGYPVIHLDDHYWHEGWRRPGPQEWHAKQRELTAGDRWIIEGSHEATLALRLERADAAVFLDRPVSICAYRVALRGLRRWMGDRGSLPARIAGDPHYRPSRSISPRFVQLVLGFGRAKERMQLALEPLAREGRLLWLRTDEEADAVVERLRAHASEAQHALR